MAATRIRRLLRETLLPRGLHVMQSSFLLRSNKNALLFRPVGLEEVTFMKKLSGYEKIMLCFGIAIAVFFAVSVMKSVSYSIVLADHTLWNSLTIYKMLGVEAAYVYAHCNESFISTLVFRLTGWCACAVMSGLLLAFRFVIPTFKWWKSKRQKKD